VSVCVCVCARARACMLACLCEQALLMTSGWENLHHVSVLTEGTRSCQKKREIKKEKSCTM
jgi:hypothetical protein